MKKMVFLLLAPVLAGCLSSAPERPKNWLIEECEFKRHVGYLVVNAPYDSCRFVVLRRDGSVAFDDFNVFAEKPTYLIKPSVFEPSSHDELKVTRLALDCRAQGERNALVELAIVRDGQQYRGRATVSAASGNYTEAFTRAFAEAYCAAWDKVIAKTVK